MNHFPRPDKQSLIHFYGNPDANGDGRPESKWESENIVRVMPAYRMFWSWNMLPVRSISIHRRCADGLTDSLREISLQFTPEEIEYYQLNRCGGGYNFRTMRGSDRLSLHSYGAAIDISPQINGLGVKYKKNSRMMPMKAVEIFRDHGAKWGGLWNRPDGMHYEWTS